MARQSDAKAIEKLAAYSFVGRFAVADSGGARFAWPGSAVSVRFSGTKLYVDLEDVGENQFYVIVDGSVRSEKFVPGPGRKVFSLVEGLTPCEHQVTLYRLTEAFLGETEFFGFEAPDGVLLAPPARLGRRIEIIGDSISAGYGIEGWSPLCSFSPDTENHYLTYGAIAARALSAELVTIAWSGKGVFSNRGSTVDTVPMPALWRRTLPMHEESRWDFARYVPDVVVINLGTNDFAPQNLRQHAFADAYRSFVDVVRETYPRATLFCTLGPLLTDALPVGAMTLSRAREAIEDTVCGLSAAGDRAVCFVEFPEVSAAEGYGCDYHPSQETHARMATQLEAAIREKLHW